MTKPDGQLPSVGAAPSGRPRYPDKDAPTGGLPWGVVLLAHGSQRGTSRAECSCSWAVPALSPSSQRVGIGLDSVEGPVLSNAEGSATPDWCQDCPSTPQGLQEAARRLQALLGTDRARVFLSCLEFIEPHPDQAMRIIAAQGLQRVIVMPYLLGHGKHATLELEEVLDGLRAQLPGLRLYLTEGLGADPQLADMVVERVHCLSAGNGRPTHPYSGDHPIGVLLVKAGTKTQYDDCQWLEELGQMVEARLGSRYAVAVAQSHYGNPTMDAATAHLVQERQASSLICVPYLFFPGMILRRNILGGLNRLKARYPHLPMAVTPPLSVDDRLVAVAAARIQEVWDQGEAARL